MDNIKTWTGYFYQMSNTYTCIAYLIEIRKFCSKNLVHKGANFEAQNALKLTYKHLSFQKKFPRVIPRTPLKRGGEGEKREGAREGRSPQFTFLATPVDMER